MIDSVDGIEELKESITDVNDELDRMVDAKLDNLAGDVTALSSAWQGFVLKGEGGVNVFRNIVQGAKDAVVILSNLDLAFWGDYTSEQADRALKAFEGFGGKAAESLNNIVKIADNLDFEVAEERFSEFAKAIEEDTHLTTQQSEAIFEAYLRRRKNK